MHINFVSVSLKISFIKPSLKLNNANYSPAKIPLQNMYEDIRKYKKTYIIFTYS